MDTINAPHDTHRTCIDILLVEDSPLIREALTEAFSALGIVNMRGFAATAQQAIDALNVTHFDMAIIDLELEEGTGFDVLAHIAKSNDGKPPLRVVLTNHAFALYEKRARQLGIEYFFDKSMHFSEAVAIIEKEAVRLIEAAQT